MTTTAPVARRRPGLRRAVPHPGTSRRRARAVRWGGQVVAVLVVALTALVPLAGPAVADDPDDDGGLAQPVDVRITTVSPDVLGPDEDLAVTVRVTNDGDTPVTEPRVTLHLDRRSFISRTSLDRWRHAGVDGALGTAVVTQDLDVALLPGEATTVTLRLPAEDVNLASRNVSWGPRGLAVSVVDTDDPARRRLGVARTFVVWFPTEPVNPTLVTVLVPLVGPAVDPYDDAWVGELEEATDGRLGQVLDATADAPFVSWVLDPWLVDVGSAPEGEVTRTSTAPDGGPTADGEPTAGPTDPASAPDSAPEGADDATGPDDDDAGPELAVAGAQARAWTERLLDATVGRDVHVLPYGDADVDALADADGLDVLAAAEARSARVVGETGLPDRATTDLVLPAQPLPDRRTLRTAARGTPQSVVVGPGRLQPPAVLTYTPTGRTTMETTAGDVTVLVPDERLSGALVSGRVGVHVDPDPARPAEAAGPTAAPTPAEAALDLLAELAVITRERPNDSRHVLLTTPRDWSPDAAVTAAQLEALARAPWVRPEPVSTLVGTPDPQVPRGELPDDVPSPGAITEGRLTALREALTTRAELATIVPRPEDLMGDPESELLALTSVAWRAQPERRGAVIESADDRTAQLADTVHVIRGSTVNLVSRTGDLPVRVANDLDQPATVEVTLQPDDWHLRVGDPVTVTVPAGAEETVYIPVHAVQSADLPVTVELRTAGGTLVNDETVDVRVRADWEGIGTITIGAVLALGLVVGVIRTIRRGRMSTRAEPVTAGPDALSPEATDEARVLEVGDEHER